MIDVVRLWLGILVAVAVPLGLPARRTNTAVRCVFTATYAAYAIFPALPLGKALITWLSVVGIGVAAQITVRRRTTAADKTLDRDDLARLAHRIWQAHRHVVYALAGLLTLLPVVAAVHFGRRSLEVLGRVLADDRVAIVVSGLLLAVFTGGDFVATAVRPLIRRLAERGADIHQIVPTSAYIGWIERTLVFTFVAGGHPEAAALAVAAKSLTRLPNVDQHPAGFGEYVLVGTLSSLLVAALTAVVVRLALGLSPV
ncbi:hypothetical protein AB0H43_17405 [Hamadaea sp. NPDC050747]|uniref:hypothetical protein n=1 Tax=Hamadaea sp. NPDC050747 TaxID=3155789 RepID=UPI0033F8B167